MPQGPSQCARVRAGVLAMEKALGLDGKKVGEKWIEVQRSCRTRDDSTSSKPGKGKSKGKGKGKGKGKKNKRR